MEGFRVLALRIGLLYKKVSNDLITYKFSKEEKEMRATEKRMKNRMVIVGISMLIVLFGMRMAPNVAYADTDDGDYDSQYDDDYDTDEEDYSDESDNGPGANTSDNSNEQDTKSDNWPYLDANRNIICDASNLFDYGKYSSNWFFGSGGTMYYGLCNDGVHEFIELHNGTGGTTTLYGIFRFSDGADKNTDADDLGESYFAWIEGVDLHAISNQFDKSIFEQRKNQILALYGNHPAIYMESGYEYSMNGKLGMQIWCYNLPGFERYSSNSMILDKEYDVNYSGFPKHDYPGGIVQSGPLVDSASGRFVSSVAGTYAYKINATTSYYCYFGFYTDNGQPFIKRERKDNDTVVGSIVTPIGGKWSRALPNNNQIEVFENLNNKYGTSHPLYSIGESGLIITNQIVIDGKYQTPADGLDYNSWYSSKRYSKISNDYPAESANAS